MKSHEIWLNYLSPSLSYGQKPQEWCRTPPGQDRVKSKFYQYFVFTKKTAPRICLILHQFNLYVLLICEK